MGLSSLTWDYQVQPPDKPNREKKSYQKYFALTSCQEHFELRGYQKIYVLIFILSQERLVLMAYLLF